MKKTSTLAFALGLILIATTACGPRETAKAGSASPEDVLRYIPAEAQGVFFVDIHRAMQTEVANKMIQEDENYQEYLKFVEESGIDPQQDIFYVALGVLSGSLLGKQEAVGVLNLSYDREKLMAVIEEKTEGEIASEDYSGITVYKPESDEDAVFAFLDASNVVIGNPGAVRSCIDVMQKTKDNVFKNEALADVLSRTDKGTIFWGAMMVPQEDMAKAAEENPQLQPLQNMNALVMNFDHKNAVMSIKIRAEGDDPDANKQIADMLNGLKAMGAMMVPEDKPEFNDLLNSVTVSHGADHVMIDASIPDEVLQKLKATIPTPEKEEK